MHESPNAPTTLQRDLMKFWSWKTLLFEVVFFFMISPWLYLSLWLPLWKSSCLITLEIWSLVLNLVLLSSKSRLTKPWFHTHTHTHIYIYIYTHIYIYIYIHTYILNVLYFYKIKKVFLIITYPNKFLFFIFKNYF